MSDLIERLRKPVSHLECEDCWYSCPKSGKCCNDNEGPECNCGADAENALRTEAADALVRAEGAEPKDDVPLRCEVVNGAIEFTIGAKILAHATNISPNLYDAENDRGQYRVTDPAAFAKEVARELDRESEDGSTPLTRLLDTVIEEAINQGAEGVEENK